MVFSKRFVTGSEKAMLKVTFLTIIILAGVRTPLSAAGKEPIDPNLADNTTSIASQPTLHIALSGLEKRILVAKGSKANLSEYFANRDGTAAVLRVVYGNGRVRMFQTVTYIFDHEKLTIEYIAYPESFQPVRDEPDVAALLLRADVEELAGRCEIWRGKLDGDKGSRIAEQINSINIWALGSCGPDWTTERLHIPLASRPGEIRHHRSSRGWLDNAFRVFFSVRMENGKLTTHNFQVNNPHKLADIRYERLFYSLQDCEPFRKVLLLMREE